MEESDFLKFIWLCPFPGALDPRPLMQSLPSMSDILTKNSLKPHAKDFAWSATP